MAKKKSSKPSRKQPHPAVTDNRALQYRDFDAQGKAVAEAGWANIGNVKSNLAGALTRTNAAITEAEASIQEMHDQGITPPKDSGPVVTLKKERANRFSLEYAQDNNLVADRPQTLTKAANSRTRLYRDAVQRSRTEGDIRTGEGPSDRPIGAGWYLKHAKDINNIADAYGHSRERLYAASGAMSPQNSPDNEKAALRAMASAHAANHDVTAKTITGARRLGIDVPSHITNDEQFAALPSEQRSKKFRDLTPEQIRAGVSKGEHRKHIDTKVDVEGLAKGGTGLTRGISIMRGDTDEKDFLASGPNGGPKVSSYVGNIRAAGSANANEVSEYYRRIHEAIPGAKPYFEQPTIFGEAWEADPWGKAKSTEGILDPQGNTAEDTWMRAISAGQPKEFSVIPGARAGGEGNRVGKFVGSSSALQKMPVTGVYPTIPGHPDPTSETIIHAMNNEATIRSAAAITRAAKKEGRNMGAGLPSMSVQESAWTEYRIQADKDPDYRKAERNLSSQFSAPSSSRKRPLGPAKTWKNV